LNRIWYNKKNNFFLKATAFLLCIFILAAILSYGVLAEESDSSSTETASSSVSTETSSRTSRLGKSPLVEKENSREAEESRLAASDTTTGVVRFFKDLYKNVSNKIDRNFISNNGWKTILNGLLVTLEITFFSAILGILIGSLLGIIRSIYDKTSKLKLPNAFAKIYITVIRGTPAVVQLMIMYFVIFQSSNNMILAAILSFGINSGAYVAEIFRSGIMSIDNGQMEAGRSLGMSYGQTMWSIILPQAVKNVLPALGNEFITLLKETSIAGYVAIEDLARAGNIIRGQTTNRSGL
jgi:His/Glu/Gln/Arg/opine family amino acid ABC transporter permease subunit